MALPILLPGSLRTDAGQASVRIALPWIRSLPLASVRDLELHLDGVPVAALVVDLGRERVAASELAHRSEWWYTQDRLVLVSPESAPSGEVNVAVSFALVIPYLSAGGPGPLTLQFFEERRLSPSTLGTGRYARDVAAHETIAS